MPSPERYPLIVFLFWPFSFGDFFPPQFDDRDKSSRSRYNGRQFLSWLQDVGDKYNNIKVKLQK